VKFVAGITAACFAVWLAATWFGYRTLWVNRYRLPFEELGTEPTRTGASLDDVLSFFD